MKKAFLILTMCFLLLSSWACGTSQQDTSADQREIFMGYLDPEIDIILLIPSTEWLYTKELYEGEVYFYPKKSTIRNYYSGFAISSDEKNACTIEYLWDLVCENFESNTSVFEWELLDDIPVGLYTGQRYHFSTDQFVGDYIFWETEERIYICSFTSSETLYEKDFSLLESSLESFQVYSDVYE